MITPPEEHVWSKQEPQPIAVPLLGHHAQHGGNRDNLRDYDFVGRDPLIKELMAVLHETRNTKGCYLISGFRGAGKTTLIDKVLLHYARGTTGPAWLPAESTGKDSGESDSKHSYTHRIKSVLDRGRIKLGACVYPPENNWLERIKIRVSHMWSSADIKNLFTSRVITIRVNLGQDESLASRDVLFNTATLLHQKLNNIKSRIELIYFAIVVVIATVLAEICLGALTAEWLKTLWQSPHLPTWLKWLNLPFLVSPQAISTLLFGVGFIGVFYYIWTRCLPTNMGILRRLERLNKRIAYTVEFNRGIHRGGFSFGRKETLPPLDARQIENELLNILAKCREIRWFPAKPDIIFVFDELDKIAHRPLSNSNSPGSPMQTSVGRDQHERKKKVDDLLGAMKNFITHGEARFFFIAGRELLDSYQAERGSTSSLYESLFSRVFEVPSLLTDSSDHNRQRMHSLLEVYVCRKLMDPDVAIYLWLHHKNRNQDKDRNWTADLHRKLMYSPFCLRTYYHYLLIIPGMSEGHAMRIVLGLRNFIQFLTLHSWGNPKRLMSLFTHFTKPIESVDWRTSEDVKNIKGSNNRVQLALQFGLTDQQRIVLASNLYTQLYHDLGRQLASSGDKLVVSTMAAFQYILKFHRYPFSRHHLERMSETLSVYHSPELNTMIDTLVSKVFHPHIRRIRNSHYRYRFNSGFEQELRYISRVSDIESAAFNFSLDAAAPIKAHYIDQLSKLTNQESTSLESPVAIYELCMIIGDLFALEQSPDEAFTYYQRAVDVLDKYMKKHRSRFTHFYVEALLRLGEIYEQRQRYDHAASVYLHAKSAVNNLKGSSLHEALSSGDSKWDVFRQPFWAYWYLQLKKSPVSSRCKLPPPFEYPFKKDNEGSEGSEGSEGNKNEDSVNHYRAGQLAFFYACHHTAVGSFLDAIEHSGIAKARTERTTYLGAYAYLHLGENLLVGLMHYQRNERNKKHADIYNSIENIAQIKSLAIEALKGICSSIENIAQIMCLAELEKTFTDTSANYLTLLREISDETTFVQKVDVGKTLGMMAHAAKLLAERELHFHAAFAYLKILSLWGMFSEIVFALTKVRNHVDYGSTEEKTLLQRSDVAKVLRQSENWIAEVRRQANASIDNLTMGGFDRFQARWLSRDVSSPVLDTLKVQPPQCKQIGLSEQLDKEWEAEIKPLLSEKYNDPEMRFHGQHVLLPLRDTLDFLFPNKDFTKMRREAKTKAKAEVDINLFLQRSMMGQKLISLSTWEYMAKIRFRSKREPVAISLQSMVPHSTRNLMFIHWLTGRRLLYWQVLDKLPNTDLSNEKEREDIYSQSAAAVHNLHRAIYYIKQLAGNDQDLMFPDSSMVLYDLWLLLYALVEWELYHSENQKEHDMAVTLVKRKLSDSTLHHNNTPGNYYDLPNVKLRAIDALRTAENLGDISNRARTDAIRTRHFLADDYEDPRFHLDWTLVQMYSPTAEILRRYVEFASVDLSKRYPSSQSDFP